VIARRQFTGTEAEKKEKNAWRQILSMEARQVKKTHGGGKWARMSK
jgi:hypothetical protein